MRWAKREEGRSEVGKEGGKREERGRKEGVRWAKREEGRSEVGKESMARYLR